MEIQFIWQQGAIETAKITHWIEDLKTDFQIGAVDIFIGQIREDIINNHPVKAIDYTAYELMAEASILNISELIAHEYELHKVVVLHSIGRVKVGEISLFVLVASKHRVSVFEACRAVVEKIKKEVPIWGKEILDTGEEVWKKNT
ncbi:MAG: molybdenum cofactor biosynthesis protein MoaE [Cytophagales bacterium]|nr:MAG: molybdenum cofactor biosynthesis protein MoaE [Cytophagales bacterium]